MASKERSNAELTLRDAEHRFKLLVDGVKEYAIYLLDPQGNVTSWNAGAERIKGYHAEEIVGANVARFYSEEEQTLGVPERALDVARCEGRFETKAWRVRKDGSKFWANVVIEPIRNDSGELLGFAKVTKDITEDRLHQERLRHLALFDQLTGLPNRHSLLADITALLDAHPAALPVSLVLVGLDDFKTINDTIGHSTGDLVLVEVASRLTQIASPAARLYRLGDDEFAIVLPSNGDPLAAADAAASALELLEPHFDLDGRRIFISASVGFAIVSETVATADELIACADLARSAAKLEGHKLRQFDPAMRAEAHARQAMDAELRRAYAQHEFVLHYQPQIRLSDGAVVGTEALLRWQHPQRGLLAPGVFIDALARSPIAADVGNWILRTGCAAAATWQTEGHEPVAVGINLLPAQFADKSLVEHVQAALRQSGLPPSALELEITENIAFSRDGDTVSKLLALRALGVGIAFDDFGTGFASLSCLTRFPVTRIKIDRSFIDKITDASSLKDTAVVRSIVTMADNLGLDVIAEGVESQQQAAFLRSKKCNQAQGLLYAKPLPLDQFERFLQTNRNQLSGSGVAVSA